MELRRVSFVVAKAIKEAGFPQKDYGHHFSKTGAQLYGAIWDFDIYAPTYLDVWLWLWREKNIYIDLVSMFENTCGVAIWKHNERIYSKFKHDDPEEAIIAAINYIVENNLIK